MARSGAPPPAADGIAIGGVPLAPVRALADPRFWPVAFRTGPRVGLLYVVWLATLGFAVAAAAGAWTIMPAADGFVGWLAERIPEVRFTADGVVSDVAQPFVLEHPQLGTVLLIDTTREEPGSEPLPFVTVLRDRLVVSARDGERRGHRRTYDAVPRTPDARAAWQTIVVDGARVRSAWAAVRPLWVLVPAVGAVLWLVWKLFAALWYALAAAPLARLLRVDVPDRGVFAAACFALTAVAVAEWAEIAGWPNLVAQPLPSAMVTLGYLLAGLLLARGASPPDD